MRHEPEHPCAKGERANGPVPIFTMHVTQRPGEADLFGRYNLTAYDEMFGHPLEFPARITRPCSNG